MAGQAEVWEGSTVPAGVQVYAGMGQACRLSLDSCSAGYGWSYCGNMWTKVRSPTCLLGLG